MTLTAELFHSAFYRFSRIENPAALADAIRRQAEGLTGQILLAHEGINGSLGGAADALARFEQWLLEVPGFAGLVFRRSACRTAPFERLKVHVRQEILPLGIAGVDAVGRRGKQLDPIAWRELLDDPNAVVIDNRNAFEFRLGHFRGAIDPGVGNFRDLPRYIESNAAAWKAAGRTVAMYCTGGIRCEKTAAWMVDAHGLEVSQLDGGILRYLAETPDAHVDWQGECFVFDKRIALDAALRETSTTAAEVYASDPDEAWRLRRAQRLDGTD